LQTILFKNEKCLQSQPDNPDTNLVGRASRSALWAARRLSPIEQSEQVREINLALQQRRAIMTRTVYEWAVEFVSLGIAVFPVGYRSKRPRLCWEQYRHRLPEPSDLRKWFLGGSLHNYAVVAGWQDLLVLDFDDL
jgi:hypothetical protein